MGPPPVGFTASCWPSAGTNYPRPFDLYRLESRRDPLTFYEDSVRGLRRCLGQIASHGTPVTVNT
jgi:hypothetical protein